MLLPGATMLELKSNICGVSLVSLKKGAILSYILVVLLVSGTVRAAFL